MIFLSIIKNLPKKNKKLIIPWTFKGTQTTFRYKTPQKEAILEWQDSAIDQDLISLNLISLPTKYKSLKNNNTSYPILDITNTPYKNLLDANGNLANFSITSSWTYLGYDPLKFEESKYYEIKPYPPLRENQKYESSSNRNFIKLAKVSLKVANKIFPKLYPLEAINDSSAEAKDFWMNVKNSQKAIFITEGQKKALSLISHGYIAVSVRGTCRAFANKTQQEPFKIELNDGLQEISSWHNRDFYLVFDSDKDTQLRSKVLSYTFEISKLLDEIKKVGDVKIISLPTNIKGVDDFLFSNGKEQFEKLIDSALNIQDFYQQVHPMPILDTFNRFPYSHKWCLNYLYGGENLVNTLNKKKKDIKQENSILKKFNINDKTTFIYKNTLLKHIQTWQQSSISQDLIDLNLRSIPDILLDRNGSYLSYPIYDLMGLDSKKILKAFKVPLNQSTRDIWTYLGYAIDGKTPNNNFEFRLSKPVRANQKYERIFSKPSIILPKVSNRIAQRIFPKRYKDIDQKKLTLEAPDFWLNVFSSNKPIYLTEGHKKALSLLSHDLIGISIHQPCLGCFINEKNELVINGDLQKLVKKKAGRFFIIFDYDPKPYLRTLVDAASVYIGEQIEKLGGKAWIINMPATNYKGLDDYINVYGFKNFKEKILSKPISIKQKKITLEKTLEDLYQEYQTNQKSYKWCFKSCKSDCIKREIKLSN